MRWNEKETYQFVKIYFAHDHLWNTRHVAYKSNERRLRAYKEVIVKFEEATGILLTLNEVRVKVKNLKSTYSQELSKIRQRSSPEFTYKPAMKWFSLWHKNIQNARKMSRDSSVEVSDAIINPYKHSNTDEDSQKLWLSLGTHNDEPDVDPFDAQHNNDYYLTVKPEHKTQFKQEANFNFEHRSIDTPDLSVQGNYDSNIDFMKEDEFDIYGKYIASQLRNMDLQRALTLQLEIQSLVSEARLADLSNQSSRQHIT